MTVIIIGYYTFRFCSKVHVWIKKSNVSFIAWIFVCAIFVICFIY